MRIDPADLAALCSAAVRRAGADTATADHLARATVEAEQRGHAPVGVTHLFDYLDALRTGAMACNPNPTVTRRGSVVTVDADEGLAHVAFHQALPLLTSTTEEQGVAVLALSNTFTCGELGYFTSSLAADGYIALAAANSPALVAAGGSDTPVLGTNPISLAAPAQPRPLLVDQGISPTAFVSIRDKARRGEPLPEGWAVDAEGHPTTDATDALGGALLTSGHKLTNLGLIVEILAGLAGAQWSLDAPSFNEGSRSPAVGMFLLAISPTALNEGFVHRLQEHLQRLEDVHNMSLPGRRRADSRQDITLDDELYTALLAAGS